MIGYYKMSMIGTAHQQTDGGVCQDYSDVKKLKKGWLVAAIADGLGSAKYSERGSAIAVNTAISYVLKQNLKKWDVKALSKILYFSFLEALKVTKKTASDEKNPVEDYDTTLSILIYNGNQVVFGHAGDGGIIGLTNDGEFELLTQVQKGEAFNETYPLRSGPEYWSFGRSQKSFCAITMMTDGIFDMACPWLLSGEEQKIYINFIRRFMDRNILKANKQEDFDIIQSQIHNFFSGNAAAAITDDKTIVGMINTSVLPKKKDEAYYAEPDWENLHRKQTAGLYAADSVNRETQTKKSEKQEKEVPVLISGRQNNEPGRHHLNNINPKTGRAIRRKRRKRLRIFIVMLILYIVSEIITVFICKKIFTRDQIYEKPRIGNTSTKSPLLKTEEPNTESPEPTEESTQEPTENPTEEAFETPDPRYRLQEDKLPIWTESTETITQN